MSILVLRTYGINKNHITVLPHSTTSSSVKFFVILAYAYQSEIWELSLGTIHKVLKGREGVKAKRTTIVFYEVTLLFKNVQGEEEVSENDQTCK